MCPDGRMRVCYQQAPSPHTPGPHSPPTTHIFTAPSSHIHLKTVTPDFTHTCTYRIMLHQHTGANGGDLQLGDQKDPYLVLKTLKFLLREWAKDLNAHSSIEKSYQVKRGAGWMCIVCVCVCMCVCVCVCVCVLCVCVCVCVVCCVIVCVQGKQWGRLLHFNW